MSKVGSILLLTDSASALPGFDNDKFPHVKIKPGEVLWNGMQIEDPIDANSRTLFSKNAEIIGKSSGIVESPRWAWADSIADASVDFDSVFVFTPHEDIFPQQVAEIIKSQVLQKTHYSDFFKKHDRKTGKLKTFVIKTQNWFSGIGLAVWQCHQLLNKLDNEKSVSLSQIKKYFEQLSARTRTVSIMPCNQLHSWTRDQIIEESLLGKIRGNIGRTQWISFEVGQDLAKVSERDSFELQVASQFNALISKIVGGQLSFARIIVSCSSQQLAQLRSIQAFYQFDELQSVHNFKWLHQPSPILAQVLTGKDAIHISYSLK